MVADEKIRREIQQRVEKIAADKLAELLEFIDKLEGDNTTDNELLSFWGSWEDIDDELFDELTIELPRKRLQESEESI